MTINDTPSDTSKDARLWRLGTHGNVAQFASFDAGLGPRYSRLAGDPEIRSLEAAVAAIKERSAATTLNVRTFLPQANKSLPFEYGKSAAEAIEYVRHYAAEGLYTIVNETIDIKDGGVSGVALGGLLEFSPEDTPRAVEREGTASLPFAMGIRLLEAVYGFAIDLPEAPSTRFEFSIHPSRVGYRRSHTLLWEEEIVGEASLESSTVWPNRFSKFIGDKVYGLLIAECLGLPVPRTTVIGRKIAPFTFGTSTGTAETWIRTAPSSQDPGRFTTAPTWMDPFVLVAGEDPGGELASVLAQEGVDALWSGASRPLEDGSDYIEGVAGRGLGYMQGDVPADQLPDEVVAEVREVLARATRALGPVRAEWAHDGAQAWVLQLHRAERADADVDVISPGSADRWLTYEPALGLPVLRELISQAVKEGATGIEVAGRIGITSHVGDLVRRAGIPGRRRRA